MQEVWGLTCQKTSRWCLRLTYSSFFCQTMRNTPSVTFGSLSAIHSVFIRITAIHHSDNSGTF